MNQVQPQYSGRLRVAEDELDGLEGVRQEREAFLLEELFRRNGRQDVVPVATPPGYAYELVRPVGGATGVDVGGPLMQIAAHPGDGPDFCYATSLLLESNRCYQYEFHEVVLTDGERGVEHWDAEQTRLVRRAEASAGAALVGSQLHFMGYPDGGLSTLSEQRRRRLVRQLAELVAQVRPALLLVHPPYRDHPDHAWAFQLTRSALVYAARWLAKRPALFVHDVEFGLRQQRIWRPCPLDVRVATYPFHVPDYLVNISATHQRAQEALYKHQTQMRDPVSGQPKAYADLIHMLAQVRGLQLGIQDEVLCSTGQGFSHIVIPDVTSEWNILAERLPAGSLYRRVKRKGNRGT